MTPRPSPPAGETPPLSVPSAVRWQALALAVLSICIVYMACPLLDAFFHNLGVLNLIHGLASETIPNPSLRLAQRWFALAARTDDWRGIRPSGPSYVWELAYLATLDPLANSYHPDLGDWFHTERGQLLQQAAIQLALRRANEARHERQSAEEKAWRILAVELQPGNAEKHKQLAVWLVSEQGDIAEAIAQYKMTIQMEEPTWQDYLRLVALNLKVGRSEQATYWHDQLRQHFPDTSYAWLHDLQDSYAQSALASAYAYFGLLDDAITIGERSLAINQWDWGHLVVAGFYQQQGNYTEVERHLLAAVAHPGSEAILIQYRAALADLYVEQGKTQQAVTEYCRVLHDAPAVDATGAQNVWRANAVSHLAALTGVAENEVPALCSSH